MDATESYRRPRTNTLDEATVKTKDANYLFEELTERLGKGPIDFQILVQGGKRH